MVDARNAGDKRKPSSFRIGLLWRYAFTRDAHRAGRPSNGNTAFANPRRHGEPFYTKDRLLLYVRCFVWDILKVFFKLINTVYIISLAATVYLNLVCRKRYE